jgi:hypothetical protein
MNKYNINTHSCGHLVYYNKIMAMSAHIIGRRVCFSANLAKKKLLPAM